MDKDEGMETWTRTWKHGEGHGDIEEAMETWRHAVIQTWKHGDMDMEPWRHAEVQTC
jgi:hypothetical protein